MSLTLPSDSGVQTLSATRSGLPKFLFFSNVVNENTAPWRGKILNFQEILAPCSKFHSRRVPPRANRPPPPPPPSAHYCLSNFFWTREDSISYSLSFLQAYLCRFQFKVPSAVVLTVYAYIMFAETPRVSEAIEEFLNSSRMADMAALKKASDKCVSAISNQVLPEPIRNSVSLFKLRSDFPLMLTKCTVTYS